MVNKTEVPAQIGDWGVLVKVGVGTASIFMVLIISVVVVHPAPAFFACNFICQHPGILTDAAGITKLSPTNHEGLKKLSMAIKSVSVGRLIYQKYSGVFKHEVVPYCPRIVVFWAVITVFTHCFSGKLKSAIGALFVLTSFWAPFPFSKYSSQ